MRKKPHIKRRVTPVLPNGEFLTALFVTTYAEALMVPETGIEPVRPLFTKAADFKSAVSTNSTTRAMD